MAQEKENFLGRWSRLKASRIALAAEKPVPQDSAAEQKPPELPPLDKLTPESDFSGFMHPKVEDALRRAALKKLFADPHFNIPDPFEAYSGDWTVGEPIPDAMMATLNQATHAAVLRQEEAGRKRGRRQKTPPRSRPPAAAKPSRRDDEPGRQDA